MRFRLSSFEKACLRQAHNDINDQRCREGKKPFRFLIVRLSQKGIIK